MARTINVRHGREFLAQRSAGTAATSVVLPGRPRVPGVIRGDGVEVDVKYSARGDSLRVICCRPLSIEPDTVFDLDGKRITLLVALDDLDASRRAWAVRALSSGRATNAEAVRRRLEGVPEAPAVGTAVTGTTDAAMSPAARKLHAYVRDACERRAYQLTHKSVLKSAWDAPIIEELVAGAAIVTLGDGHLVDTESLEAFALRARSMERFTSRDAAAAWETSHGLAKAVLLWLVERGDLARSGGGYVRVPGDGRAHAAGNDST